jgi:hypothetical protein
LDDFNARQAKNRRLSETTILAEMERDRKEANVEGPKGHTQLKKMLDNAREHRVPGGLRLKKKDSA